MVYGTAAELFPCLTCSFLHWLPPQFEMAEKDIQPHQKGTFQVHKSLANLSGIYVVGAGRCAKRLTNPFEVEEPFR